MSETANTDERPAKRPAFPRWRMLLYLFMLLGMLAYQKRHLFWIADRTLQTEHYVIHSTAGEQETAAVGVAAEALYVAFAEIMSQYVKLTADHPRLKMRLYANRDEFRRFNNVSYAEGYYRRPCCHQYYDSDAINPYHWAIHEGVHQLCSEVADVSLEKWLSEGLACYVATSCFENGRIVPGKVDANTYPVVWMQDMLAEAVDVESDIEAGRILPLHVIITGKGGPRIGAAVNLYYIQWWSLVHFLFEYENGTYRRAIGPLIRDGGSLEAFIEHVGPLADVQLLWYEHLLDLKKQADTFTPPPEIWPQPEADAPQLPSTPQHTGCLTSEASQS